MSVGTAIAPARGLLELSLVAGRTAATRSFATSPLKLLIPRRRTAAAWVYAGTYGGGLVAGDEIDLDVRIGPKALGVLGTQASTKVYRSPRPDSLPANVEGQRCGRRAAGSRA